MGMNGDVGPTGAVGETGATGENGERGEAGPQGVMGEKGDVAEMAGAGLIAWNQCSWANLNAGQNFGQLVVGPPISGQGVGVLIRCPIVCVLMREVSCCCVS